MIECIKNGEYDSVFSALYQDVSAARERYINAINGFYQKFGKQDVKLVSAPGRTEIGGNHTDHQHGRALAAAVDLDTICVCAPNNENIIRVEAENFEPCVVELSDLLPHEEEKGTGSALIRGVAAWFKSHGYTVRGFNAYTSTSVPMGAGLSSSAAFEAAIGNALCVVGETKSATLEIALAGQYAENIYFGKPCGLLDQIAVSYGGLVMIDFANPDDPKVESLDADLDGYALCVVDTKGNHAGLTHEYAAIPNDMRSIAKHFGKNYLRELEPEMLYKNISELRKYGDRAILRAMHFFCDNERVMRQVEALTENRITDFLRLVNESGRSSAFLLQNIYPSCNPEKQELTLALAITEKIIGEQGACRIHGGGFAGTIQAYVPLNLKDTCKTAMEAVFGKDCCHFLKIRSIGGMEVKL